MTKSEWFLWLICLALALWAFMGAIHRMIVDPVIMGGSPWFL